MNDPTVADEASPFEAQSASNISNGAFEEWEVRGVRAASTHRLFAVGPTGKPYVAMVRGKGKADLVAAAPKLLRTADALLAALAPGEGSTLAPAAWAASRALRAAVVAAMFGAEVAADAFGVRSEATITDDAVPGKTPSNSKATSGNSGTKNKTQQKPRETK